MVICAGPARPLPSPPMKQYHEPIQVEVGDDGLPVDWWERQLLDSRV